MSTPQAVNVTVTATIVPVAGGAINGYGHTSTFVSDFKSNPIHNITIKANARQAWVAVKGLADTVSGEGPESFEVVLSSPNGPAGIGLGRSVGTGTILDATGLAAGQILVGSSSLPEGDTFAGCTNCKFTAKLPVLLTGPKAAASATYSTVGTGGATAPADFTTKINKPLTFTLTGATYKTLTVITNGNNNVDPGKGINFVFSNPVGTPPVATAHVSILDNE